MSGRITLKGVGKYYKRYPSIRAKLLEIFSFGCKMTHQPQWVLQDVDLEVAPGEAVALIGYNGAGKSTLLKLISGTSTQSTGTVDVQGRMAALLELGIGFHPEFTGRQNITMAGNLLGFSSEEMARAGHEIVDFAELGVWIDEPLRTYSSGMQARLAFSIATAIRPDILIVDEVLSVGDAYFQHKSFARIREYRNLGTTLLFVSHDFGAIRALCDRAILLDGGRKLKDGEPAEVLDYFHALVLDRERQAGIVQQAGKSATSTHSGSGEVRVEKIELLGRDGNPRNILHCGESSTLRVFCQVNEAVDSLVIGIMLRDKVGNPVFGTNSHHLGINLENLSPGERIQMDFQQNLDLGQGSYSVSYGLIDSALAVRRNYDWQDGALVFELINRDFPVSIGTALLHTTTVITRRQAE